MDVLSLRTNIETKVRDANNQILSDAQILELLNEGQKEYSTFTGEIVQLNGFTVSSPQYDYPAPTDIVKLRQGWWLPLRAYELKVANEWDMSMQGAFDNTPGGYPRAIAQAAEGSVQRLKVWPPPTSSSASTTMNDAGGIDSSVTSITLTSAAALRSAPGWVQIDNEKILYQRVNGNTLELCRRGALGTSAASHSDGATVTQIDLLISYSRFPTALSGDSSVPEIQLSRHQDLEYYVLFHAMLLDARPDAAAAYRSLWEAAKLAARKETYRVQAAAPARRIRSPYGP